MSDDSLYVSFFIDCEATQPAVNNVALGERASAGFAQILEKHGLRGTFHVLPTDLRASSALYRKLAANGHEIGLHIHPVLDGYGEFLGAYGPEDQHKILRRACDAFADVMGSPVDNICIGYASTNDFTYGVLHDLGFRHGTTSFPTRVLPECVSIHAGAPLDVHYAHRFNRSLPGDLDYVEIPLTVDPESRMWSGKHPQDLRVELVDAKNHGFLIRKTVERQVATKQPVKVLRGITHNIFEYGDERDFRRETLVGMIAHTKSAAEKNGLTWTPATGAEIAAAYRAAVPLPTKEKK